MCASYSIPASQQATCKQENNAALKLPSCASPHHVVLEKCLQIDICRTFNRVDLLTRCVQQWASLVRKPASRFRSSDSMRGGGVCVGLSWFIISVSVSQSRLRLGRRGYRLRCGSRLRRNIFFRGEHATTGCSAVDEGVWWEVLTITKQIFIKGTLF